MSKLYVVSYHEVQIAGYRIFASYDDALKEYLKHCIIETQTLLDEDDDEDEEKVEDEEKEDEEFDELSAVLEIQELQDNEYVTIKEYDYEAFQVLIENKDDDEVPVFLDELEKNIENNTIPDEIRALFS